MRMNSGYLYIKLIKIYDGGKDNVLKRLPLNKSQPTPRFVSLAKAMNNLKGSVKMLLCASGQVEIAMK